MSRNFTRISGAGVLLSILASCGPNGGYDPDMRGWFPGGLSTADAAQTAASRPQPDSRGLISFPDYQIAIAQAGDTPATIAARLGLGADEMARHNALPPDAKLLAGSVLVLPRRVQAGVPAAGGTGIVSTTGQVTDPFAGQGVKKPAVPDGPTATPESTAASVGGQPRQHVVVTGETAWSIARKYGVSVQDLASWNGLPASTMSVRIGQRLIVPVPGQKAPGATGVTTAPGTGSPTPRPPSAADPLPDEKTAPAATPAPSSEAPDLGKTRTSASAGQFSMPVSGAIIRTYEKGKNDGIDIAAPNGTTVKAAGSGSVAAITNDTAGRPIVVLRHTNGLMTVYTGLSGLDVAKGDTVATGQSLGKAGNGGFVHFEVRRGFESTDPEGYLN